MGESREISRGMARLLAGLHQRFGVDLTPYANKADHLNAVYEHYSRKRQHIRVFLGEGVCYDSEDYTKAYLISEAARLLLREIAPKRTKRNKKRKSK